MLMVHIRMQLGTDISVQMQTKAMGGGSEPVSDYLLFYYYNRTKTGWFSRLHMWSSVQMTVERHCSKC